MQTSNINISNFINRLEQIEQEGGKINQVPVFGRIFKWIKYQIYETEIQKMMNYLINEKLVEEKWKASLNITSNNPAEIWKKMQSVDNATLIFENKDLHDKIKNIASWGIFGEERIQKFEHRANETISHFLMKELDKVIDAPIPIHGKNPSNALKLDIVSQRLINLCQIYKKIKDNENLIHPESGKKKHKQEQAQLRGIESKLMTFFSKVEHLYKNFQQELLEQNITESDNYRDKEMENLYQMVETTTGKTIERKNLYAVDQNEVVNKYLARTRSWLHKAPNHPVSQYLKNEKFSNNAKFLLEKMISASGTTDQQKIKYIDQCFRALTLGYMVDSPQANIDKNILFEAAFLSWPKLTLQVKELLNKIDLSEGTDQQQQHYQNIMNILRTIESDKMPSV